MTSTNRIKQLKEIVDFLELRVGEESYLKTKIDEIIHSERQRWADEKYKLTEK